MVHDLLGRFAHAIHGDLERMLIDLGRTEEQLKAPHVKGDGCVPAKKIVDEGEVKKWFAEGKSYPWMVETYMSKYGIEIGESAFGNFRRAHGLSRRNVRDDNLIPWLVKPEHRHAWPLTMLRLLARRRAGQELSIKRNHDLDVWLKGLERDNVVVHYDPDTPEGFHYVTRLKKDDDVIRFPPRRTTKQPNLDVRDT